MLKSFRVKNYRCFKDLTVEPLDRVNLIAGKNNVGKSALLEALWLFHEYDNPQIAAWVNIVRTPARPMPGKELWELFREFDPRNQIEISAADDQDQTRTLEIEIVRRRDRPIALYSDLQEPSKRKPLLTPSTPPLLEEPFESELNYRYTDSKGRENQLSASIGEDGKMTLKEPASVPRLKSFLFMTGDPRVGERMSEQLSELLIAKRENHVLEVMRLLDPRLKQLMVAHRAGSPMIYADIGLKSQVPIFLMGEGIRRLLAIALLLDDYKYGAIFIDEIENGLHYSVMEDVWRAIMVWARQFNIQVFATTHSKECIRAAHEAFSGAETYDFRLHRLDSIRGEIQSVTYDRETLGSVLDAGWEVR